MRILTTVILAAVTFGIASCAHDKPAPAPAPASDGKTAHHAHGYRK